MKKEINLDQLTTSFTSNELWYLLNLYAPAMVIGIENPYLGRLAEEIKTSEQTALDSLFARQIIRLTNKNSLEIADITIKTMIETCLNTKSCLWLTISHSQQNNTITQYLIYFSHGQIVYVEHKDEQNYSLLAVQNSDEIKELIKKSTASLVVQDHPASSEFVLEQSVFDASIKAFDSKDDQAGRQILLTAGLSELPIKELKSALGDEGCIILAYKINNPTHPDQCHVQGLGYLNGQFGGWTIQQYKQNGSDFIRFQPETINQFQESLFSLVQ